MLKGREYLQCSSGNWDCSCRGIGLKGSWFGWEELDGWDSEEDCRMIRISFTIEWEWELSWSSSLIGGGGGLLENFLFDGVRGELWFWLKFMKFEISSVWFGVLDLTERLNGFFVISL